MRVERSPPLRGRNPSKQKRSTGRPDIASAASTADGPGSTVTATPSSTASATSRKPGSLTVGMPASDTTRMVCAGMGEIDQLARSLALDRVVERDHPAAYPDAEVGRQALRAPRVLGSDDVRGGEGLDQSRGRITGVAERCRGEHDPADGPAARPRSRIRLAIAHPPWIARLRWPGDRDRSACRRGRGRDGARGGRPAPPRAHRAGARSAPRRGLPARATRAADAVQRHPRVDRADHRHGHRRPAAVRRAGPAACADLRRDVLPQVRALGMLRLRVREEDGRGRQRPDPRVRRQLAHPRPVHRRPGVRRPSAARQVDDRRRRAPVRCDPLRLALRGRRPGHPHRSS